MIAKTKWPLPKHCSGSKRGMTTVRGYYCSWLDRVYYIDPLTTYNCGHYRGLEGFTFKKKADEDEAAQPKFASVTVIPTQPLLKISSTSLQHGSGMLFEGEKTTVRLTLENIGSIPVDFVTLTF